MAEREEVSAMANTDIKNIAQKCNVKLWQIANELLITDTSFSKKLRKELSKEDKKKIISIIKKIKNSLISK